MTVFDMIPHSPVRVEAPMIFARLVLAFEAVPEMAVSIRDT